MSVSIKATNLGFEFDNGEILFSNLSFQINFGEITAVIGESGAGKSTLLNLISGFETPTSGKIRIKGQEPRKFIESNPGTVSYLGQSTSIVSGTILENVTLFEEKPDLDFAKKLLTEVGLEKVVSRLADTRLEVGGSYKLSGGQLQRLGIARALYTRPSTLILDEPTSALDPKNKKLILSLIKKQKHQPAVIIASHSHSVLQEADQVVFLGETVGVIRKSGGKFTSKQLRELGFTL